MQEIRSSHRIRIDLQDPQLRSESTVEAAALIAVADRTDKTLKPAALEWNYPPHGAVEIPLNSTASIGPTGPLDLQGPQINTTVEDPQELH